MTIFRVSLIKKMYVQKFIFTLTFTYTLFFLFLFLISISLENKTNILKNREQNKNNIKRLRP